MARPFSIVLADDHVMFRRGVRSLVQGLAGIEVIGEASDGLELLAVLKKTRPDLAIIDISMPNLRGLEAIREIKAIDPGVKVLILTMHKDREYLDHALSAGAAGYLLKEDADTELLTAIDTLRKGGTYISPLLSAQLTELLREKSRAAGDPGVAREPLTIREKEVLKLIAEGKSSKEIGELLFISSRTVQHHRANLMRKLDLKRTADLVRYAIQRGYTTSHQA
jgi:DNA-binding NarL/FixJ family response regulator